MPAQKPGVKNFIVARHSEKPSSVWGDEWLELATKTGRYVSVDTNMVCGSGRYGAHSTCLLMGETIQLTKLPISGRALAEYLTDQPLTNFGVNLSQQLGVALARAKLAPGTY